MGIDGGQTQCGRWKEAIVGVVAVTAAHRVFDAGAAGCCRAGKPVIGHGKAEQGVAGVGQDLVGIAKIANILLGRQRQQHPAQQQGDDEHHDGEFDQREAVTERG